MALPKSSKNKLPRFRLKKVEGPAHGGPFELEQDTSWYVYDRVTKTKVLSFFGEYSTVFGNGDWRAGTYSGVKDVELAPDGRHVVVREADGLVRTILIPGAADLPPLVAWNPPAEFPVQLDGLVIDAQTDLKQLVKRVMEEGFVPKGADVEQRDHPPLWLCRLYKWLGPTSRASEISATIGEHVSLDDKKGCGQALFFYERFPGATGFQHVVALAEAQPVGAAARKHKVFSFEEVGGPVPLSLLAKRLWERYSSGEKPDELDERASQVLKGVLLRSDCPWPEPRVFSKKSQTYLANRRVRALRGLAFHSEWLAQQAALIEKARSEWPGRWQALINALVWAEQTNLIPVAVEALLTRGVVTPKALVDWAKEYPYKSRHPWLKLLHQQVKDLS